MSAPTPTSLQQKLTIVCDELKNIPIIIVTAKSYSIDKVLGLHVAKVNDYVTKPFGPNELLASIEKVLGIRL